MDIILSDMDETHVRQALRTILRKLRHARGGDVNLPQRGIDGCVRVNLDRLEYWGHAPRFFYAESHPHAPIIPTREFLQGIGAL
jgi:hypothetical protein